MEKIMSIDAETNGLHGAAFSIAAVLRHEDGDVEELLLRCPIVGDIEPWVKENVLPEMVNIKQTHTSYPAMLEAFAKFYLENKEDCTVIVHCGLPVETRLFIDMYNYEFIGNWETPLPLVNISAMLLMAGEDPTSVDSYNSKNEIKLKKKEGGTHNPLYNSWAALLAYDNLMKR